MKIVVLVENNTESNLCEGQHGLGLYIETGDRKILFDTGQNELFYNNAKKLGVSIEDVDIMVLSHGHSDHGGGMSCFLQRNRKAKVYIHDLAFDEYYSRASSPPRYIGLDQSCKEDARLVRNTECLRIDDKLELFSLPENNSRSFWPKGNETLAVRNPPPRPGAGLPLREGDEYVQDLFLHEQSLIITENGKRHLIAGCAHGGITNIIEYAEKLYGCIDTVVGGFHLYNSGTKQTDPKELVHALAGRLSQYKAIFYTGHCTGKMGFVMLREIMGDQVRAISTGDILEL